MVGADDATVLQLDRLEARAKSIPGAPCRRNDICIFNDYGPVEDLENESEEQTVAGDELVCLGSRKGRTE